MQEEGFVAKLLYPEGAKDVELGKVVAVLVENKADIAAFENYTGESGGAAPAQQPAAQETPAATTPSSAPAKLEPNLSQT